MLDEIDSGVHSQFVQWLGEEKPVEEVKDNPEMPTVAQKRQPEPRP